MKFTLVAVVVAFLCATAVSGAPSTPNESFEELAFSEAFSENSSQWGDKLRCIIDLLDKEIVDELGGLWTKTKADLNQLIDDWLQCSSNGTIFDQIICKTTVVTKSVNIVTTILNELNKVVGPIKIREIQKKIYSECLKKPSFFEEDYSEEFGVPEQFQCLLDVVGDVSKANGLEELWSKSQPQLQLHLDNWKKCQELDNKVAQILCSVKEGFAFYGVMREYFQLVGAQNPPVLLQILRKTQEQCGTSQTFVDMFENEDAIEFGIIGSTIEKLNCIVNATSEALIGTEFAKPWEKLRKDIRVYINTIKACKDQPTDWQEAKCVVSTSTKSYRVVFNFFRNVRKLNREISDNIKIQIKARCSK